MADTETNGRPNVHRTVMGRAATDAFSFTSTHSETHRGKGSERDYVAKQVVQERSALTLVQARSLYNTHWMAALIADVMSEDMTREGWDIVIPDDEGLATAIMTRQAELDLASKLSMGLRDDIVYGDGIGTLGITGGNANPELEITRSSIESVDYINHVPREKVNTWTLDEDPMSSTFGLPKFYSMAVGGPEPNRRVHADRVFHLQMRPDIGGEKFGSSIYRQLWPTFQVIDNAEWSIGQLMYRLSQIVYKMVGWHELAGGNPDDPDDQGLDDTLVQQAHSAFDADINTLSSYIVDAEDQIFALSETSNLGPVRGLLDFVWEIASGGSRIPKSHLLGEQQGTVSGAGFDTHRYFSRVRGLQEDHLTDPIRKVTDYLLWEQGHDPEDVDYDIKFRPLLVLDEQQEAEVERNYAEADAIYLDRQVLSSDEVRQKRFGKKPLSEELQVDPEPGGPDEPEEEGEAPETGDAVLDQMQVQTLILSKSIFGSPEEARAWVRDHDFRADKIDETDDTYRFRQFDPNQCNENSFRTFSIRGVDGVQAVGCIPKGE